PAGAGASGGSGGGSGGAGGVLAAVPWSTFGVNLLGCALIGVLMVLVAEREGAHPLLRPFLGTGVLGGFTTFSTYAVEVVELLEDGRTATAAGYALGTVLGALAAVTAGAVATRAAVRRVVRRRGRPPREAVAGDGRGRP
ncbi:fluoride efflux transporter FluC, partial [Streptomyces sp. URMC 123]|uniref:fluoride efflux transporter FluC n=1 Tax=Streptomyces sp. URMC 123 TaxID=3423403 RepID=UPI003F1DFB12